MTDREVSPDELRDVAAHLRGCRDCAFESTMIVGLKRLLGSWDGVHASETFRAGVLERVKAAPPERELPSLPWRTLAAVGAAVVGAGALAAAVVFMLPGRTPAPGPGGQGEHAAAGREEAPTASRIGRVAAGDTTTRTALSASPVALVFVTQKAVYIKHADSSLSLACADDELRPGQSIRTTENGSAEVLLLAAGCRVALEPGSELAFPADAPGAGDGSVGELRAGTIFIRGPDEPGRRASPFTVGCGARSVVLKSSDLLIEIGRQDAGAVRVAVAKGEADVTVAGGTERLRSGDIFVAGRDAKPRKAEVDELARLWRWGTAK